MEKKTAEEVLDNNCKAVYGFNKSKENSRIYERKDIITAMEEYSSLQSEEKDKEIKLVQPIMAQQLIEIERLREACIWAKSVFQKLADEGRYPEFLLAENGGDGIMPITKALSNQPIESDKERLYDLCKKCEGKGFIEWVPSVTNKDTPLRERIAIAVVTPLCKSAVDPEEVSDAVLEEVQPIIEAKDREIADLQINLSTAEGRIKELEEELQLLNSRLMPKDAFKDIK